MVSPMRDARIERAIGVLENDLDALAVRLQQPARQVGDFVARKTNAAGGRIDQPDDAARHRRFAGTAFADDAERAALAQGQRDILRRPPPRARRRKTSVRDRPCRVRWPPAPPARMIPRAAPAAPGSAPPTAGCGCIPWPGVRRMVSSVPVSTSRPCRITATRSAISATTPMSWVMKARRCRDRAADRGSGSGFASGW